MKKRKTLRTVAGAGIVAAIAVGAFATVSLGGPQPHPSSSAYAYGSSAPYASAMPSTSASAKPIPTTPTGPPVAARKPTWIPPSEKSDRPKEDEWAHAEKLDLARDHYRCAAKKIREWVHVQCKSPGETFVGIRVIGGSHQDVMVSNPKEGEFRHKDLAVVFPVRRGDRRVLEFAATEPPRWKSWTVFEYLDIVVSELWLESDDSPTLVVH